MLALSSGLLRTGLALKLNQVKRATRSYLRDRTNQATGTATAYAVAAGLFAAAGIFLIAALLVGATALFRWIEINYGLFQAFGAIGGLLRADRCDLRGSGGQPAEAPGTAIPVAGEPPARRHQRQSDQAGPGRGGNQYRDGDLARTCYACERHQPCTADLPSRPGRGQQEGAGRPDRGGIAAGLGGDTTAAARATNGALMPGRRTEAADNLLLVAATAIFVLTAQRYLETITAPEPVREPAIVLPPLLRARNLAGRARQAFQQPLPDSLGRLEGHPVAHLSADRR